MDFSKVASSPPLGLQQEEHRGDEEACSSFTDKCRYQSSNKIDLTKKGKSDCLLLFWTRPNLKVQVT